ncbi:MAG TPA: epoxyqueuosine reductase QueH [Candidatus Sulfobium mesophilum]|jgi:predicted adenine nucleotide alpha hydrolase (AANH) superfamily ATPase|nr:epoxyqueuosine reductase QueH [Candidatus Sulfobium mesophilum]
MKLLMHICCSNCCLYPLEVFLAKGVDVTGFWFNPNIHPYTEFSQRLDSLRKLQRIWNLDIRYDESYALDDFLKSVVGKGSRRCEACYSIRLKETALTAKKMGIEGFTTSLLASPYQKFDMIISLGEEIGRNEGVPFFHEDLRKGWNFSRSLVSEFGLYRQKYCGCIYSEMDRYAKKKDGHSAEKKVE